MINTEDKDFHEKFLAPEKDWILVLARSTSPAHTHNTPSQNRYTFFRGRTLKIKDRRDIEYFKGNDPQFRVVKEDEEIIVKEIPGTPTLKNPMPNTDVEIKVKKKEKVNKVKGEEII